MIFEFFFYFRYVHAVRDYGTGYTMVSWVSITSTALVLAMAEVGFYLPLLTAHSHSTYYLNFNIHSIRVNNSLTAIVHILY
jgi:hypothetical protein